MKAGSQLTAWRWSGALLILSLVTVALFLPVFSGLAQGSPRYFEWDVAEQYWPDLVYLCEGLHDGELPLWNPYDRAGYPYYADPQAGAYHPMNWAICAVDRSPGLGWATTRVVLSFLLAGVFGVLWLRRLELPMSGAIVGATVIEAAPFMRHNWELNLTSALAWLPLMLWATERAVVERRALDGIVLGLSVALCAWVGSPPALWFAATLTAAYALMRSGMQVKAHGRAVVIGATGVLALATLVSAGLTAAVLVPGLTLAEHSVQAGRDYASIAEGGLELSELRALFSPRPGNHLYVGLVPLALASFALRRIRALPIFFAGVAIVAIAMALGDHAPFFSLAFDWVPGVDFFRLPHRYEAWLGPVLGALAAFGVKDLAEVDVGDRWRSWCTKGAPVAVAIGVALGLLSTGMALLFLGFGATLFAIRHHRRDALSLFFGGALALLTIADVSASLPVERHMRADTPPGSDAAAARVVPEIPGTDANYRYMDEFGIGCRSGTRLRRRDMRGYQDPLMLSAYERVIGSLRDTPTLASQYNVRYAAQGPHFIHGWNRHYLPPPNELRQLPRALPRGSGVTELSDALPFAYFVPDVFVEHVPDRSAALARVREVAPAPVAILEDGRHEEGDAGGERTSEQASGVNVELGRDELAFQITTPGDGLVVINEAFYPGWIATVDGVPVEVTRVNALVRAVRVTAGAHEIRMRFSPRDGASLRWLLLATLLLSGFALVLLVRRPKNADSVG